MGVLTVKVGSKVRKSGEGWMDDTRWLVYLTLNEEGHKEKYLLSVNVHIKE